MIYRVSDQQAEPTFHAPKEAARAAPRRWVVERTFARIVKNRRLVRNDEQITAVAETLITSAASATLMCRWQ